MGGRTGDFSDALIRVSTGSKGGRANRFSVCSAAGFVRTRVLCTGSGGSSDGPMTGCLAVRSSVTASIAESLT